MKKPSLKKQVEVVAAPETPFPNDRERFILRESLTSINSQLIQSIVDAAKEDNEDYIYALYHLAWFATMNLQIEVDRSWSFAKKLGPFVEAWPVLVTNSSNYLSGMLNFVEEIALGSKSNAALDSKKTGRQHTKARELVSGLILLIDGVRKSSNFLHAARHYGELLSTVGDDHSRDENVELLRSQIRFFSENTRNMFMQCKGALRGLGATLGIRGVENAAFGNWEKQALMLPKLNQDTAPLWIKMGMQIISDLTDQHPENIPFLFDLGRYKLKAFYRKEAKRRLFKEKIDNEVTALAKILEADDVAMKTAVSFLYEGITTRLVEACKKMVQVE